MANFKYLLIVIILLLSLNIAEAQVPRLISVQGRLLDSSDQPITTTVSIVFRIFDDYTIGAPDNELWSETRSITPDSYGVFNVILGGVSPLNINFNIPTYLQVEVEGEVLSPRYNITALPYGFRGVVAENLSSSGRIYIQPENTLPGSYFYGSGSAQGLVLTDNLIVSGNVGIGTTSADQKLSVVGNIGLSGGNRFIGTIDNYALSLRTSNSDRLWITSDGNVGIGTTSPGAKLDIAGNIRWSGTLIGGSVPWARLTSFPSACPSGQYVTAVGSSLSCSTPPGGVGGSGSDNYIPRWSGSSSLENSVIYQTDGGNVGIGTTDPGNYKLKVAGDGSITGNLAVGGGIGAGGLAPATGYGIVAQGSTGGGYFYDTDGTSRAYLAYGDYAIWSEGGAGIVARGSQWGGWFYDTDGTSRVFLARGSYGIYQDTGSTNYFAGSIGIGTADPGNWRLNVQSSGTDHPRGLSSIAGGGTTTVGIAGRGRDASTSNYGVYAYAGGPDGSTNYGVYARATCTSGTCTKWGLYVVEGNAYFAGNIYKTGTVNFVQDLNETHKLVYTSSESGEIEVEWTDSIFVDKEVFVPFPDHYRYVLSKKEDYHVLATPVNSLARVGVFNKTTEGFTLKSSEPTQVDFHVRGIRSGYEDHPIIITR